jgi:glycosyltransferase involved in cell wall biosynthesis
LQILFLTQVLPYPLDAGPKTRAYYVLRYLAQQHEVTLLTFVRPSDPPEAIEHLRKFCQALYTVPIRRSRMRDGWHLVRSVVSATPFLIARDWSPDMARQVEQLSRDKAFDAVHADQLWMAPYALLARKSSGQPIATILDQHNAVFQIPRRLAQHESNPLKRALLALEERKMAGHEIEICRQFDHVAWVTQEDLAALRIKMAERVESSQALDDKSTVFPICADPGEKPVIERKPDARRVTFLGGLHWPPNVQGALWFARQVWPRVREQSPDAVLTIIGRHPPGAEADMDSLRAVAEVTGYVPDPLPYLAETAAFIVPLHAGGGMRVKIIDAWSWGLPIVSTTIGAEGVDYHDGDNLLIADAPDQFAASVSRILAEPDLADRLGAAGRRTVEESYNWRTIYAAWDNVYARALKLAQLAGKEYRIIT